MSHCAKRRCKQFGLGFGHVQCHVQRQRIPAPSCGHRKSLVANGHVFCRRHLQLCSGSRPQPPSRVGIGDSTDVGGKVGRRKTVLAAIRLNCQTECYALWYSQPVELTEQRRHMVELARHQRDDEGLEDLLGDTSSDAVQLTKDCEAASRCPKDNVNSQISD